MKGNIETPDDIVTVRRDGDPTQGAFLTGEQFRVVSRPRKLVKEYCLERVRARVGRDDADKAVTLRPGGERIAVNEADYEYLFSDYYDDAPVVRARTFDEIADQAIDIAQRAVESTGRGDMLAPRRMVRVPCSPDALALFFAAPVGTTTQVHQQPLPQGAQFRGVTHDQLNDMLYLWFEHESFPLVDEGSYPERRDVVFHTARAGSMA